MQTGTSLVEFTPDKPLTTEEALKELTVLHPLCKQVEPLPYVRTSWPA
jgi:hypothetical protein